MSVHSVNNPGGGMVVIRRGAKESQSAFNDSKADAKYSLAGEQHTLTLDGKLDGPVAKQLSNNSDASLITDLRELAKRAPELKAACQEADNFYLENDKVLNASPEEILAVGKVDLGTGTTWTAFPMTSILGEGSPYLFSDNQGLQKVHVNFTDDNQMTVNLNTSDPKKNFSHSMSGQVGTNGTFNPSQEFVEWNISNR